ncbi:MAG: carbonate dehydratase [Chlamydiia bacterium]|nr:carbonate dehydratase [Chlamydiia bacterium]
MRTLRKFFESNQQWASERLARDPDYFTKASVKQTPKYMWLGCSDSRIPANEITGMEPGELFVHRNIANLFPHTDFNCLSVLQYAVDYLQIEHVIVCGHYGCGGVAAAMENAQFGLVDHWLKNIRDVAYQERNQLEGIEEYDRRYRKLVELNVLHQVMNVCHSTIVQSAWARGRTISIHGWVYDIYTGLLKDLNCCISSLQQVEECYHTLKLH